MQPRQTVEESMSDLTGLLGSFYIHSMNKPYFFIQIPFFFTSGISTDIVPIDFSNFRVVQNNENLE